MFTAALLTTAKTWKQPKCPSTEEWIKKMWHIYTMEYYSAIKKNEIMPFVATQMDLEIVILNEISQSDKYHMISLLCGIFKKKDTTELIYKTKVESRMQKTNLWLRDGWGG